MNTQGKQLFQVDGPYDLDTYVTFLIDFDHPECQQVLRAMSCFWMHAPQDDAPLEEHVEHWLKVAAHRAYTLHQREFGLDDVARLTQVLSHDEGYCALDGSRGISIVDCCFDEYDSDDFEVQNLPICTCVACGCTDISACEPQCRWVKVNRNEGIGLCSQCTDKKDLWLEAIQNKNTGKQS